MRNPDGARHEGFGEWADLSEALIRGLSHGLTNRVSSLGSFVQLHGMGDTEFTVDGFLPKEAAQLQEMARALRLLVVDSDASAIEFEPLVDDAIELYSHHMRMHALRCKLTTSGDAMLPIRVVRSAMLRLLVMLLDMAAADTIEEHGTLVPVTLTSTPMELALRVPSRTMPSAYAMALAEQAGASLLANDGMLELKIPTLLALRAR
jgi:hypothetical protein